jgi:hypothetical protein
MDVDDLSPNLECDVDLLGARNCPDRSQGLQIGELSTSHTTVYAVGNRSVKTLILDEVGN